jgi:hypothetical protein
MITSPVEIKGLRDKNIENIVSSKSGGLAIDKNGICYYWGLKPIDLTTGIPDTTAKP